MLIHLPVVLLLWSSSGESDDTAFSRTPSVQGKVARQECSASDEAREARPIAMASNTRLLQVSMRDSLQELHTVSNTSESSRQQDFEVSSRTGACYISNDTGGALVSSIRLACPAMCPYSQPLAGEVCWKACVAAAGCRHVHPARIFANNATMACEYACGALPEDRIGGCMDCAGVGKCKTCGFLHYVSKDGHACMYQLEWLWQVLFVLVVLILMGIVCYLVYACSRPVLNAEVCAKGVTHRKNCHPMQLQSADDGSLAWASFPLAGTAVWKTDVCGLGVALYFRWLFFLFGATALLLLGLLGAYYIPLHEVGLMAEPPSAWKEDISHCPYIAKEMVSLSTLSQTSNLSLAEHDALFKFKPVIRLRNPLKKFRTIGSVGKTGSSSNITEPSEESHPYHLPSGDLNEYPQRMAISMSVLYVIITILSLSFSVLQYRFASTWKRDHPSHSQYAVLAMGLPPDAVDPEELRRFFQHALDGLVIGVSVSYDAVDAHEVVSGAVDDVIADIESPDSPKLVLSRKTKRFSFNLGALLTKRGIRGRTAAMGRAADRARGVVASFAQGAGASPASESPTARKREGQHSFGATPDDVAGVVESEEEDEQRLEELTCSGAAVVILSSQSAVEQLLLSAPIYPHITDAGSSSSPLVLSRLASEPPELLWENVPQQTSWVKKLLLSLVFVLGLIACCLIYIFVSAHSAARTDPDSAKSTDQMKVNDFVLGMCVAGSNQLLSLITYAIVGQFGFLERHHHDALVMSLIFVGCAFNTIFDIGNIILGHRGASLSDIWSGESSRNGYDRAVAEEIFLLFVPGYLLMPYIIALAWENLIPFYIQKKLVETRPRINQRMAEAMMSPPEFDIVWRYADILNYFTMIMFLLLFTTPHAYEVIGWLLLFVVFIAIFDYVRLLRYTCQTFYNSEMLSAAFSYWWSLPTGFLGGIAAWWTLESGFVQERYSSAWIVALVVVHVVLYCALLKLLRRWSPAQVCPGELSYYEMCGKAWKRGRVYTYFNTNWPQILRTRLVDSAASEGRESQNEEEAFGAASRIPLVKGKHHLQPLVPQVLPA